MKFSIITINFNNREGLRRTIDSVVNQTFKDFEYIIIDGGSTDGSVDIIKEYSDKITYWVSEPDKGIYNAMNKGTLKASGEYCLYLNSGDYLYNNEVLMKVFKANIKADIATGDLITCKSIYRSPQKATIKNFIYDSLAHPSSFIKRNLFANELYDESYKICADQKFFTNQFIKYNVSYEKINSIITVFDLGGISRTDFTLGTIETMRMQSETIPQLILDDYYTFLGYTDKHYLLYNKIYNSKFRNIMYIIISAMVYLTIPISKLSSNVTKIIRHKVYRNNTI